MIEKKTAGETIADEYAHSADLDNLVEAIDAALSDRTEAAARAVWPLGRNGDEIITRHSAAFAIRKLND